MLERLLATNDVFSPDPFSIRLMGFGIDSFISI